MVTQFNSVYYFFVIIVIFTVFRKDVSFSYVLLRLEYYVIPMANNIASNIMMVTDRF